MNERGQRDRRTQISLGEKDRKRGLDAQRGEERRVAYGTSESPEIGCTRGGGQHGEQDTGVHVCVDGGLGRVSWLAVSQEIGDTEGGGGGAGLTCDALCGWVDRLAVCHCGGRGVRLLMLKTLRAADE
jgi:hypothetical protein